MDNQAGDRKTGNLKILNTHARTIHIQAPKSLCSKDVHIVLFYAHIHFAVPVFLSPA
jgi:hypothetical protein